VRLGCLRAIVFAAFFSQGLFGTQVAIASGFAEFDESFGGEVAGAADEVFLPDGARLQ